MTASGRNGLDTGAVAANTPYYLYAIPPTSGRTFDPVASVTAPTTGPTGFPKWSYVGACATDSGAASFIGFKASNGFYLANEEFEGENVAAAGARTGKTFASCPATATKMWVQLIANAGAGSAGEAVTLSGLDNTEDSMEVNCHVDSIDDLAVGWVPIFEASKIYLTPDTNTQVDCQLMGWQEDPMEYQ